MKRSFFQAAVVSILLYGCTTWTLTKRLEKNLDGNYIRMLRAILNKSRRQHPTRHQLYGHLTPITKTIQVRRTRHAGQCRSSRDELIRNVLLWTPTYGRAKAGRPARTYIQQLCEDTGYNPEDLPGAMNDKEKWRERITTGWWWQRIHSTNLGSFVSHQLFLPLIAHEIWGEYSFSFIFLTSRSDWSKRMGFISQKLSAFQKYQLLLKFLCQRCGLDKPVTSC